jgi:thiamine-monophosphate kinase
VESGGVKQFFCGRLPLEFSPVWWSDGIQGMVFKPYAIETETVERVFIDWLRSQVTSSESVVLGPADDCAIVDVNPGRQEVLTTDMLMDGVDFICSQQDLAQIGRKCMAVNLSDLAAMGATPKFALVSLSLPQAWSVDEAQQLMSGIFSMSQEFGISVVGGDTNSWNHPLAVSITAIGEVASGTAWRRGGAQVGDRLIVTGPCGGSILQKHLRFSPKILEAKWLRERSGIHAAIDVSDGLAWDTFQIAKASGWGVILNESSIPIAADAVARASETGRLPLNHAMEDGEDFELVLAVDPESLLAIQEDWPFAQPLVDFGEVVETEGFWLRDSDGVLSSYRPHGYEH